MERTINEPYGFIYITTNMVNGMRYVGKKVFDSSSKWGSYLGSGVKLKEDIKVYGRENFKKDIIDIAYSQEELNEKEVDYIAFLNAEFSKDYYNVDMGGIPTKRINFSGEKHPMYGKHHTDEARRKVSIAMTGRIPPNKGVSASEETKAKQKEAWRKRKERGFKVHTNKPIIEVNSGVRYDSIIDACKALNLVYGSVLHVLNGSRTSVYGYKFIYEEV